MSAKTGLPTETQAYLDDVRAALADLSPDEREDLLTEVEDSLLEASEDGEHAVAARLGPAPQFAAELRASAGLPPAPDPEAAEPAGTTSARAMLAAALAHPVVRRSGGLARDLAPLWWVARAVVVVVAVAWLAGLGPSTWSQRLPGLPAHSAALVLLAAAAAASVLIGAATRRNGRPARRVARAVDVALVLLALPVGGYLLDQRGYVALRPEAVAMEALPASGLSLDGTPVRNIYPYSRDGQALFDVLLYDDAGRPIEIGAQAEDPDRRVPVSSSGEPAFNAFPIRYFEPGTRRVADPEAAPPIARRRLTTPALDAAAEATSATGGRR